jgi:hypothetical protein
MAISPFAGFLVLLYSIASVIVGILFSRFVAEIHPDRSASTSTSAPSATRATCADTSSDL